MVATIVTLTLNPSVDRFLEVPRLTLNEVNRAVRVRSAPGGHGLQVAWGVRTLGGESAAVFVCGGESGRQLVQSFSSAGVSVRPVWTSEPTRQNVDIIDLATREHTRVHEPGATVGRRLLEEVEEAFFELAEGAYSIVIGGSLPPGVDKRYYAQLARKAAQRGFAVVADATPDALAEIIQARPFLVKPDQEQTEALLGRLLYAADEFALAAKEIAQRGAQWAIVSIGRLGGFCSDGSRCYHYYGPAVEAQNAVGVGDAFLAGLLTALQQHKPMQEALALGAGAGTACAQSDEGPFFSAELARQLAEEVRVEEMAL
ncbi:MAG: hexose kinase [Firmicutes bacterium]|nr:hexose kinase [Bacillota bacterium]